MTVIAIDGPSGSGKSTISRHLAEALHLPYLDTGAMYRAVGLLALQKSVALNDEPGLVKLAAEMKLQMQDDRNKQGLIEAKVIANGADITSEIRGVDATQAASTIAVHPMLRERLVKRQRNWVEIHEGGVVEGRDIGTIVFPNADLKVFLTASAEERISRRQSDLNAPDFSFLTRGDVSKEMSERDSRDSNRAASPLVPAADSLIVDTTKKPIDDVILEITVELRKRFDGQLPMGNR